MKIPRDISGKNLSKKLEEYGYNITRQKGSHLRLTKISKEGKHNITIPQHKNLKIGTLNNILKDVSESIGISRDELMRKIF